jgi:ferredoxin
MRVVIDRELCVGSGSCVYLAPELFDQHEDGRVVLIAEHPEPAQREPARTAAAHCPVSAISVIE